MNDCQRLSTLVSSTPECAETLPAELKRHAEDCLLCQAEVHAAARLTALLETASDYELPAFAARRALARAEIKDNPRSGGVRVWAPVASTVILVACIVGVIAFAGQRNEQPAATPEQPGQAAFTPGSGTDSPSQATLTEEAPRAVKEAEHALHATGCVSDEDASCAAGATLETGPGETRVVKLSDSTTLTLNHNTMVVLTRALGRSMTLKRGEILLDVVKQAPLPPLLVEVPQGTVRVVGTRLLISQLAEASTVTVLRGTVIALSTEGSKPVGAGEQATIRAERVPVVRAAANLGEVTRWAEVEVDTADEEGTMAIGTLRARRAGAKKDTELALRLTDHQVRVNIQGQLARTEVEEAFHNDTKNTLEGVYSFPIPRGAQIAGLDLLVDGEWMEGAIVSRERGEKIWRGVIRNAAPKHVKQEIIEYVWVPGPWKDPALLTWKEGTNFELRIFPIPAKGERRVRIAWTETLPRVAGGRRYVYPLASRGEGTVAAERFRLDVSIGGGAVGVRSTPFELKEEQAEGQTRLRTDMRAFVPSGDLVLDIPQPESAESELRAWSYQAPAGALADKAYGLVSLQPDLPGRGGAAGAEELDVLFVVDRSYSMQQERLARAAKLVARVTRELSPKSRVHVLACADRCQSIGPGFRAASATAATDLQQRIEQLQPLGATRLLHALDRAGRTLPSENGDRGARIIYLGDGTPSVGELDPARLAGAVPGAVRGARLTTVSLGGTSDELTLGALAQAGRGSHVAHGAAATLRSTAWQVLQRQWGEPLRNVAIELPGGAEELAPARLADLWPGEERLVAFRMAGAASGDVVLKGTRGGEPFEQRWAVNLEPRTDRGNAFLPRLWAEKRIHALQQNGGKVEDIVALSTKHHVLSRHTSLLVLESEAMAKAFDVQATRPSVDWSGDEESSFESVNTLADGLSNLSHGVGGESLGDNGYKKIGGLKAKSGKGKSMSSLSGGSDGTWAARKPSFAKRESAVRVKMGRASSSGAMDSDVVRRVIRRRTAQIRAVYERSLKSNPNLKGKTTMQFTIGPDGRVTHATANGSMPAEMRQRLVQIMRRWRFPAPQDGGSVNVAYPLVFSSRGGSGSAGSQPRNSRQMGIGLMGRRRGGRYVAMKKEWYRQATITRHKGETASDRREQQKRETRLGENPESRDRTRDLARWHVRMADLESAETLALRWLEKDRMDAGALVTLSDLATLQGDPERGRELLASAVDVDRRSGKAHTRMMAVYEAAGDEELRCAHALTRALVGPAEWQAQVAAIRCGGERERHLAGLSKAHKRKAERALAKEPKKQRVSGSMSVDATWEGDAQLDVVVVTPKGRLVSWLGGARKTRVVDADGLQHEKLALSTGEVGRYQVIVRHRSAGADGENATPVSGSVTIRAHGERRRLSFVTDGEQARVGEVRVQRKWRRVRVR